MKQLLNSPIVWTALVLSIGVLAGCSLAAGSATDAPPLPALSAISSTAEASRVTSMEAPTASASTAVPTLLPTALPLPTASPSPTKTPLDQPVVRQLTATGCCTQPAWSSDASQIWFIDRPDSASPVGIYGVDVQNPGPPRLITERLGVYTPERDFLIQVAGNSTILERLADGRRWTVATQGEGVILSPQRTQIAWTVDPDVVVEERISQLWVADLDGGNAQSVAQLPRGGLSGWLDEATLLITSRATLQDRVSRLETLDLATGDRILLAEDERLRSVQIAPGGQWVSYMISFNVDTTRNGLWVTAADGSLQTRLPQELFGAYQWRNESELVIIPFDPAATWHTVLSYRPADGAVTTLVDPQVTPIKIANGDWQISPDGRAMVFLSAAQKNVWVVLFTPAS